MDFSLTEEQLELTAAIRSFARSELNDGLTQNDTASEFPRDKWTKCAAFGLLGLPIPVEYGGHGQDLVTTIAAMEALGHGCRDNGLVFSINAQMWACEMPILHFGSDAQKRRWLPGLVGGQVIAAHAITEPDAGSDIFSLRAKAQRADGGYRLNGTKTFSTNAPVADLVVAFAFLDRSTQGKPPVLTAFLVERDSPGITFGRHIEKMGLRTSPMGEVFLDDCFVPESHRLGPEGAGAKIFNSAMEWERACIFAAHLGAMERLLEDCVKYARDRRQFGHAIGKFESVANRIVDMKVAIDAGRFLLYRVGWLKQRGKSAIMEAAIAKLFVSENHVRAALDALQVYGGYGYMRDFPVEREVRDALSGTIYSGTSDIQRKIIAQCLGL